MENKSCRICKHPKLKLVRQLDWPLFKCLHCDLVQAYPFPSKEEVDNLYRGNYWKNYAPYGSQLKAHQIYFERKIKEIKKLKKPGKLLDVGCALGTFLKVAKDHHYKVEGIDISDYAVSYCRKNNLPAFASVISRFSSKNKYDVVTAFETLEHEYDPLNALKKINSFLVPGGLLVITVPNTDTLTKKIMGKFWFGYKNKEHVFHFNKKSLNYILEKAGYKDIKITDDINRPYLFVYGLERLNFYLFKSAFFDKLIKQLKKIHIIAGLTIGFNPWGNLIAYAKKQHD